MSSSNVFFEQHGRTMFGIPFGYAVEYTLTREAGVEHVRFGDKLIIPDDPQNWQKPLPTDLVSECLFELAKQKKHLLVSLYGVWMNFNETETLFDIKRRIRQMQRALIKFDGKVDADIKNYLTNGVYDLIKGMPVH